MASHELSEKEIMTIGLSRPYLVQSIDKFVYQIPLTNSNTTSFLSFFQVHIIDQLSSTVPILQIGECFKCDIDVDENPKHSTPTKNTR